MTDTTKIEAPQNAPKTRSQLQAADVSALLRARNPLLWVVTREEARVERYLIEAAVAAGYIPRTWDIAQGVADAGGKPQPNLGSGDPGDMLARIRDRNQDRGVWIMRDLPPWLSGPLGAAPNRQLRNLARALPTAPREKAQAIIVITPSGEVPPELAGHTTVIEWPLPDRAEIAAILDAAIEALPDEMKTTAAPNGTRDLAIDAAVGLSGVEAQACYARSLVQLRRIDPKLVAGEKKRIIAKEGVLEWYDPLPGGLDAVGGLDNLKTWIRQRKLAYSKAARDYGLPAPKGVCLGGPPGTGKSLTAKATATGFDMPLLKLDLGALKSKFVGESEANLRKAFRVIESVGRCVVWVDEIEKALAGATQGAADGGVSSDALGGLLNWMQERQSESFVIATTNDAEALPPELLRKGRFDELFFVDLPAGQERGGVLKAALTANGRKDAQVDHQAVAACCNGFTGSEIAALVPEAMFAAFADGGREITTADLVAVAKVVVPLSKTAEAKIKRMREWANGKMRPANSVSFEAEESSKGPALDF